MKRERLKNMKKKYLMIDDYVSNRGLDKTKEVIGI